MELSEIDVLAGFGKFKFKPFMLVCVERERAGEESFTQCKTQNEVAGFLREIAGLPEFANSKLLKALERALRFEVHESAELLFEWLKGGDGDLGESILLGVPRGQSWKHQVLSLSFRALWSLPGINTLPVRKVIREWLTKLFRKMPEGETLAFYAGYPVFTLSSGKRAMSVEGKFQSLQETLNALESTTGNDNLRSVVIESLVLALSTALWEKGQFSKARSLVNRALRYRPHSIHLKATRHALNMQEANVLARAGAFKFKPFMLVCVERGRPGDEIYLQCKTQNEAGSFLREIAGLPEFANSKLLKALERALRFEVHESAELLFDWFRRDEADFGESILLGVPRGQSWKHRILSLSFRALWSVPGINTLPVRKIVRERLAKLFRRMPKGETLAFYAGYPVFTFSSRKRAMSAEEKVQSLQETLNALESTTGNDNLRSAVIESIAFALSRILGFLGNFESAASSVNRGLKYRPYSIYLKAAKHALSLRNSGKAVPERLIKFIGEDNNFLKKFVCPEPFKRFDIGPGGDVLVCCGHWLPTPIGNFKLDAVDAILNSATAQKLRQSVTDGSYQYCNHLDCGAMIQDTLPLREELVDHQIIDAIATQDFKITRVEQVLFAFDQSCNLSCPSCRRERIIEKASLSEANALAVEQKLVPLLPQIHTLNINPAGELFASRSSRKLLELINDERCPDLKLQIISNGTLFNEQEWNKFPGIHNKIQWVRISVDAARKETFEKLRRLGIHAMFVDNMRFLSQLRDSGIIPQLMFSFTYQVGNFREMAEFVEFCKSMRCDFTIFERLQNLGAFDQAEFEQNAVHLPEHELHGEFLNLIRNPVFKEQSVWHDFDYDGVATMSRELALARQ